MKNALAALTTSTLLTSGVFAADYTITVNENTKKGAVTGDMLGTNLVHTKNTLNSNFQNTFNGLGLKTLRFPGGTVTEDDFFLDDSGDIAELTAFLVFCKQNSITPVLVVPTKRYVTDEENQTLLTGQALSDGIDAGAAAAAQFVHDVNNTLSLGDDYYVKHWEIGNEYYSSIGEEGGLLDGGVPTSIYQDLAVRFATAMRLEDSTIVPLVNVKRTSTEYQGIASYISTATGGSNVKGVVAHVYPAFQPEAPNYLSLNSRVAATDEDVQEVETQLTAIGNAFGFGKVHVTEWNMGSGNSPGGMIAPSYQIPIFEQLVLGKTTLATQWPMMWTTTGSVSNMLAESSGTLTAQGQVADWLVEYSNGRELLDVATSSDNIKAVAFGTNNSEMTIFIMCRNIVSDSSIQVTVNGFTINSRSAQRLTRTDPTVATRTPATIETVVPSLSGDKKTMTLTGNKTNKWEIIRITCTM